MTYTLTLRKDAELDIEEQFSYYEDVREGLGHDFLLCVEEALDKIQRNPLNYRKLHKELRRMAIRRFPYRIFFLVQTSKNNRNGCIPYTKKSNIMGFTHITEGGLSMTVNAWLAFLGSYERYCYFSLSALENKDV